MQHQNQNERRHQTRSVSRSTVVAGLAAALLLVVMTAAPSSASAANNWVCEAGEFCMGYQYNLSGGLYQTTITDPDLGDNTFYYWTDPARNETLGRVSNNTWSMKNNHSTYEVLVYDGAYHTGQWRASRGRGGS